MEGEINNMINISGGYGGWDKTIGITPVEDIEGETKL